MRAQYMVTSNCIQTGTIRLTRSLREMLSGKEQVRCVDEDGDALTCTVNWVEGVLEGLAPYFEKRRLQVNDVVWFTLEDDTVNLEAAAARKARPRPFVRAQEEPQSAPVEQKVAVPVQQRVQPPAREPETPGRAPTRRVRVTPHTSEKPRGAQPPHVALLETLGLKHTASEGVDVFRAYLGRREYALALGRDGVTSPADLLALRRTGGADYVAMLVPEERKEALEKELGATRTALVTPEALTRLVSLKKLFPVGPVELERLLKGGRVDEEAVSRLADEVRRWVGERAVFSAVLLALAEYTRQQVFFAEDVLANLGEGRWEPEQVRAVLEALTGPPFLLLERAGAGEYILREPVADNLAHLAEYALSLRSRIVSE